uniref:ICOS ligand n=1 Tax=Fundulus heteroclitus TaxID=8078 RepID=A0A147AHW4_FUNHE
MSAFLTASLVFALLVSSFSISAGQGNITAEPGDNVILPCRAAENKDVISVEWSRTDLESDECVLLYKDSQYNQAVQSPFFKNRVDLLDVENRNVSLVLKNVTTNDTGTYECRVFEKGNNRRKRLAVKSSSTIDLNVKPGNQEKLKEDGGNKDGQMEDGGNKDEIKEGGGNKDGPKEDGGNKTGLIAGLSVFALVVVVVGAVLYKKSRYSSLKSKCPPAIAAAVIGDTTLKELVEKNP